jgi:hypothetical protein
MFVELLGSLPLRRGCNIDSNELVIVSWVHE